MISSATESGEFKDTKGTVPFMAPEVWRISISGAAAKDIYIQLGGGGGGWCGQTVKKSWLHGYCFESQGIETQY